jgi:hypothetical protein
MSRLIINTGTFPNDKSGDTLQAAFTKVNANFAELYTLTGGTNANLKELIQDAIAEMIADGTLFGISATYDDPNNALDLYNTFSSIDSGFASTIYSAQDLSFDGGNATTATFTDMLINGGAA